jgi:hypothetical protein
MNTKVSGINSQITIFQQLLYRRNQRERQVELPSDLQECVHVSSAFPYKVLCHMKTADTYKACGNTFGTMQSLQAISSVDQPYP